MRTIALIIAAIALGGPASTLAFDLKPSMREQVKLGKSASEQIRKDPKVKVLPDTDLRVKLLRRIADRLMKTIPEKEVKSKPWVYSFDVIQDDEINAFALPGGPVFFNTGLLKMMDTEDQVAGVLAHEIIHVRKEHWARDYARTLEQQGLFLIAGLLLGVNDTLMQGASLLETYGLQLPRSRRFETEADTEGYAMMVQAGYNPQGMVDVFVMLNANHKGKPPEFMSTHPDEKNRIKKLQDMLAKAPQAYPPQTPIVGPWRKREQAILQVRGLLVGR
ncbi:MAG TPA: M48 family metallopeptidase [Fimbriimonadaceae bacterium]|nr:M48 family metallopeptidase [Fimbriimonadaceae bacterium]